MDYHQIETDVTFDLARWSILPVREQLTIKKLKVKI
jgi:hypothetical protein